MGLYLPEALASEMYPFFRDVREQGMGGAAVAVVDDDTALFLNPAGLGKIRGPSLTLLNPEVESNYDTFSALSTGGNLGNATSAQGLLTMGVQNPNKHIHSMVEVLPSFATTNFAVAGYAKYASDGQYNPSTQLFHLDYFNDDGAALGYCFRLLSGRLKIGVTGKVINRVYISKDIPASSTGLTIPSLASEGDGVGWDGGVLIAAPWAWLPTIGVVAHDIGNTYFTMGNGIFYRPGTIPPPQTQSVDAAVAVFPILSNTTRSSFTVEFRNIQNPQTQNINLNIHGGGRNRFCRSIFHSWWVQRRVLHGRSRV